jgi:phage baseplate assembly protein gpV
VSSSSCLVGLSDGHVAHHGPLRLGIVKDQDASLGRLRVAFSEFDGMLSYWLPVVATKTQNDKAYWLPDIGEQVVCLMDARDEAGVVLGAIYSQADSTPVQSADKCHLGFKDGTSMEYDRSAHVLSLNFQDAANIKYDSGAHALAVSFPDQTVFKYDAAAHSWVIEFSDGTEIRYDGVIHAFSMLGGAGTSVSVTAPAGITLQSDKSYVTILPSGVTVNPPLT